MNEVSLLGFYKLKGGLLGPRGVLSMPLTYTGLAQTNQKYTRLPAAKSSVDRISDMNLSAEIGKYVSY